MHARACSIHTNTNTYTSMEITHTLWQRGHTTAKRQTSPPMAVGANYKSYCAPIHKHLSVRLVNHSPAPYSFSFCCVCAYVCMSVCTHAWVCVCVCVCVCKCVCMCVIVRVCMFVSLAKPYVTYTVVPLFFSHFQEHLMPNREICYLSWAKMKAGSPHFPVFSKLSQVSYQVPFFSHSHPLWSVIHDSCELWSPLSTPHTPLPHLKSRLTASLRIS